MRKGVWQISTPNPRLRAIAILIAIVILAAVFLFAWNIIFPPQFDEQRVIDLLSRHDSELAKAEFSWMEVEDEYNRTFDEFGSYDFFNDSGTLIGWRGADVRRDETGIINGRMLVVAGTARPVELDNTSTKWACPDGTTLEITIAVTATYLYAGAAGNALTRYMLESLEGEATIPILSTMQEIADILNSTLENASQMNLTEAVAADVAKSRDALYKYRNAIDMVEKSMVTSEVCYFRPDQTEEFEAAKARFQEMVAGCEIAA